VQRTFVRGDLVRAQAEAEKNCEYYSSRDPSWGWKFRILHARILGWRGMYADVLKVLNLGVPPSLNNSDVVLQKEVLEGAAHAHLHRCEQAQTLLADATQRCIGSSSLACGEVLTVQGVLQVERGEYELARPFYEKSLQIAQEQGDRFAEASALLKLNQLELLEEHFDESIDWSNRAYDTARAIGAQSIMMSSQGNLGWAHYKTGDPEGAMELLLEAEKRAEQVGSIDNQIDWLTTAGYIYVDQGKFPVAEDFYSKALNLATTVNSKEGMLNARISLAFVSVLTGKHDLARQYSEQAIASARADGNRVDELYPLFTKGQVAARQGNIPEAETIFSEVTNDAKVDPSLKWEAQHEVANLYADQHQTTRAQAAYRATLATFETARSQIQHEGVKLPFLSNASSLYDDYVRFLLSENKTADALSVADHARARTLAEGLGQLRKGDSVLPTMLDGQRIARRAGGPILYYFLGAKQSHLWVITAQKTSRFELPPASEIDAAVRRYRKALETPRDLAESQNPDGLALYQMLVQPARPLLANSAKVFIVPDGSLNALNFEALLAPDPKPHYWIEDVTIANASSLRLLDRAAARSRSQKRRLLLVGNPLAASPEFGTLPQAASEIANIGKRFPSNEQRVLSQAEATPAAYLAGQPEQFSYIHFVAHGTASRLSPLDSAIVLSKAGPADDSFRLYARDIIQHPLHADLVTISSCYGAGTRAYSGEGLVGLSWAFLRAGAHNVIGALWDVSDASTPKLMDEMYAAIEKGKPPEEALRIAKLSLLHSGDSFRRPFYWAPFQFYTGS
jgi:CHAT domain-containing protein